MYNLLGKNKSIAIIAPSFASKKTDVSKLAKILKNSGFKPKVFISFKNNFMFSDSDKNRAKYLIKAFNNCDIILPIRGGYGSAKLIPYLSKVKKPKTKKLLLGSSDITALHLFINNCWSWPSLHSPVGEHLLKSPTDRKNLINIIAGNKKKICYKITALNKLKKQISGILTGGNLSICLSSFKTLFEINS